MYVKVNEMLKVRPVPPLFASSYGYKFENKEWQDELSLNLYDFGGRLYDPATVRTPQYDPLCEKFYDVSPQSFLSNNPLRFIDPTGMESEDSIDPPGKKTAMQRAYNSKTGNTDVAKLVMYKIADVLESVNSYVREKIEPSDREITTTATSKKGGGENEKSTGKKVGDNISADAFLDGAPGTAKTGNNLISNKDIMKAAADLGKLSDKMDKAEKKVKEVIKENSGKGKSPSDMVQTVNDPKNPNNNQSVRRDVLEAQQKKK
jgi:RHS repeat-associated protein